MPVMAVGAASFDPRMPWILLDEDQEGSPYWIDDPDFRGDPNLYLQAGMMLEFDEPVEMRRGSHDPDDEEIADYYDPAGSYPVIRRVTGIIYAAHD